MKRFLVIYDGASGFCELINVGIFKADNEAEARGAAGEQWDTTAKLIAFDLDDCEDGWSYYA